MPHLNGHNLTIWEKGDQLRAVDLNENFAALADRVEAAMTEARLPDPANVALEMTIARLAARVAALESLTAMHARQRNEKEWAPLSHLGALVTLVNQACRQLEETAHRIDEAHAGFAVEHEDLGRRLARIEQQPDSAAQEDFAVLARDHERLALKEHMLFAQIIALRHEVRVLRDLATAKDRVANRLEFAPMAYVGHLLSRIRDIEAKLPGATAP